MEVLGDVASSLARGDVPPAVAEALSLARLTALRKGNGKVRGIATGDTLRRLVARTLAQQLCCPLLGVSSFALMAQRLAPDDQPFWIAQTLPRRGVVAGRYRMQGNEVLELEAPHLLSEDQQVTPAVQASDDVDADVAQLLRCLQGALQGGQPLPWSQVLPLYPTSPVGPVHS